MDSLQPLQLAIIGSGYGSASLLVHLLDRRSERASGITVFGPKPFGHGAAFSTVHPDFRLNVRAQIMQMRPAQPDDFLQWATHNISDPEAHRPEGAFYRRVDFARYLDEQINGLAGIDEVRFVSHKVVSFHYDQKQALWQLILDNQQALWAQTIILATGNPEPEWPCQMDEGCRKDMSDQLISAPWSGEWLSEIRPEQKIVLVGGGLTAMDAIYALGKAEHHSKISIITPPGILPPAQTDWQPDEAINWPEDITSASGFLNFMNSKLKQNTRYSWSDPVWQSRFEALRVNLNPAWRRLADTQKRRLIRHLGSSWSLARYRAAPQTSEMVSQLATAGQLSIYTGRAEAILSTSDKKQLLVRLSDSLVLDADIVVNCTGMGRDQLLMKMFAKNILQADAFERGPRLTNNLALRFASGQVCPSGYAFGAMSAGSEGDVVGAATIARQAAVLARHISAAKG